MNEQIDMNKSFTQSEEDDYYIEKIYELNQEVENLRELAPKSKLIKEFCDGFDLVYNHIMNDEDMEIFYAYENLTYEIWESFIKNKKIENKFKNNKIVMQQIQIFQEILDENKGISGEELLKIQQ